MPDYKQGKIYCIRSHQTDEIYIGSTTQPLSKRMVEHRARYKKWKNGRMDDYRSSSELIKYDDCYIELIEECPCDNKNQLERREGQLIREMDCVNKRVAGRTQKEYHKECKEYIAERDKKYRKNNKEKLKELHKKLYEAHKNDYKCEVCNYTGCVNKYNRHLKTKKHLHNSSTFSPSTG